MVRPSNRSLAAIVGTGAAAALLIFTPAQEGRELTTYRDIGGVLTYCDGATENAMAGRVYTNAECNAQLDHDLARHAEGVNACAPMSRLTLGQRIAFVDAAYNIGIVGFCGSSMARLANAGDVVGSCAALFAWNGIVRNGVKTPIKGLILRRLRAIEICLTRK
ncbi:glycosyl hydrolase [Massilia eurypsychrophila]|uniref:Lysozyme n=1 Tax=Massilia eurypsychrophila TaxID=1485217 RepID=A0A2G8T8D5_9BURK|nr:lysozyme [Massilia eurypsychrophila]PIL42233.1 glycosyl hydrolase [Massilia eurypsychrophila]